MAGPTASPVEAEEIVATGVTASPHVARPSLASLGPRHFASIDNFGVPIVGPGATVGTVETRVPRAGLPGPRRLFSLIFAKDLALQACRGSPSLSRLSKLVEAPIKLGESRQGISPQEGVSRRHQEFC